MHFSMQQSKLRKVFMLVCKVAPKNCPIYTKNLTDPTIIRKILQSQI